VPIRQKEELTIRPDATAKLFVKFIANARAMVKNISMRMMISSTVRCGLSSMAIAT
jgi:hypothetical protein